MQQRFCECGCRVWVTYVMTGKRIRHRYKVQSKMGSSVSCPCCGRRINIHDLR